MNFSFQSSEILETLLKSSCAAQDILDHVKIFFNFILAKMESLHAPVTDIKMLWHLYDTEGTSQVYRQALRWFGFLVPHEKHLQMLLAMVYKRQLDLEKKVDDDGVGFNDYGRENMSNPTVDIQFDKCTEKLTSIVNTPLNVKMEAKKENKTVDHDTRKNNKGSTIDDPKSDLERINLANASVPHDMGKVVAGNNNYCKLRKEGLELRAALPEFGENNVDKKLMETLNHWLVDDDMKEVLKRIMTIVIYSLNVGRDDKKMSVVNHIG